MRLFTAALFVMHRRRPDLDPGTRYISEYAVGPDGWLMTAAFGTLGVGATAIGGGLFLTGKREGMVPLDAALLSGYGMCMCLVGLYRTDLSVAGAPRTAEGSIHNRAALHAARFIVLAMAALPLRRRANRWRLQRGRYMPGMALLTGGSLLSIGRSRYPGRQQRLFFALCLLWLHDVGDRLRIQAGS